MRKTRFVAMSLALLMLVGMIAVDRLALASVNANLECSDIDGCSGMASCGGPGTVSNCTLHCEAGGAISCLELKFQ